MTPAQRAIKTCQIWISEPSNTQGFVQLVTDAITAAVAEERERCAKVAESMTDGVHIVYCTGIAAAIREAKP